MRHLHKSKELTKIAPNITASDLRRHVVETTFYRLITDPFIPGDMIDWLGKQYELYRQLDSIENEE